MLIVILIIIIIIAFLVINLLKVGSGTPVLNNSIKYFNNNYRMFKNMFSNINIDVARFKELDSKCSFPTESSLGNKIVETVKKFEYDLDKIPLAYKNINHFDDLLDEKYPIFDLNKLEIENFNGFQCVKIPAEFKVYKGMDGFYPKGYKFPVDPKNRILWYGNELVAFQYALRYGGSINAYKFKKDEYLLLNNTHNMTILYNILKRYLRGSVNEELLKWFSVKFNTCIDPAERFNLFSSINFKAKIYKCEEKIDEKTIVNPIGQGKLDRLCYNLLALILDNYDIKGIFTFPGYSIYYPSCTLGSEVVLTDPSLVERNTKDPLDWSNWDFGYKFPSADEFIFNPKFKGKNKQHNIINFYVDNMEKTKVPKPEGLRIATLNVHFFKSINLLHSEQDCVNAMFDFMEEYDIDILGVQEVSLLLEDALTRDGFLTYIHESEILTNMVIYKDTSIKLSSEFLPGVDRKRNVIWIEVNGIKMALTHLEIFDIFSVYLTDGEKEKLTEQMINIQIEQLDFIIDKKVDIIFGDCNFNKNESPYAHIKNQYEDGLVDEPTTPFGTKVDYVWNRKKSKIDVSRYVVNYLYSDHKAIIADLKK